MDPPLSPVLGSDDRLIPPREHPRLIIAQQNRENLPLNLENILGFNFWTKFWLLMLLHGLVSSWQSPFDIYNRATNPCPRTLPSNNLIYPRLDIYSATHCEFPKLNRRLRSQSFVTQLPSNERMPIVANSSGLNLFSPSL